MLTTIDLRGHGRSDTPDGPYTIPLYAADVAVALKAIHGDDVRVHAAGISLGWGTCFSLAFNYPQLILTISGSGFLTNQVNAKGRWLKKVGVDEPQPGPRGPRQTSRPEIGEVALADDNRLSGVLPTQLGGEMEPSQLALSDQDEPPRARYKRTTPVHLASPACRESHTPRRSAWRSTAWPGRAAPALPTDHRCAAAPRALACQRGIGIP